MNRRIVLLLIGLLACATASAEQLASNTIELQSTFKGNQAVSYTHLRAHET